jgi:hypothetical protein
MAKTPPDQPRGPVLTIVVGSVTSKSHGHWGSETPIGIIQANAPAPSGTKRPPKRLTRIGAGQAMVIDRIGTPCAISCRACPNVIWRIAVKYCSKSPAILIAVAVR